MYRFAAGAGRRFCCCWPVSSSGKARRSATRSHPAAPPARAAPAQAEVEEDEEGALRTAASADARTKEQRRFDRADKDKNGRVTLAEMHQPRRRAFARLDTNGDGRLSFEEWAVRTSTRFGMRMPIATGSDAGGVCDDSAAAAGSGAAEGGGVRVLVPPVAVRTGRGTICRTADGGG
jgi:hypothetical protein